MEESERTNLVALAGMKAVRKVPGLAPDEGEAKRHNNVGEIGEANVV